MRARRSSLVGGAGALALVAGLVVGLPTAAQAVVGDRPGGDQRGVRRRRQHRCHLPARLHRAGTTPAPSRWTSPAGRSSTARRRGSTYQVDAAEPRAPRGRLVRRARGRGDNRPDRHSRDWRRDRDDRDWRVRPARSLLVPASRDRLDLRHRLRLRVWGRGLRRLRHGKRLRGNRAAPAAPSNTLSVSRNGSHADTGNNATDFATGAPSPEACGTACSPPDAAPRVTATTPADGAGGVDASANLSVTFSESVGPDERLQPRPVGASTSRSPSLRPTRRTHLDPTSNLPTSGSCTLTVRALGVADSDTRRPAGRPRRRRGQ